LAALTYSSYALPVLLYQTFTEGASRRKQQQHQHQFEHHPAGKEPAALTKEARGNKIVTKGHCLLIINYQGSGTPPLLFALWG